MNNDLSTTWVILLVVLALWEVTWKGVALWKAGRNNDTVWFVAILVINSVGILPIAYILLKKGGSHESTS